jgi:hypothetical protein
MGPFIASEIFLILVGRAVSTVPFLFPVSLSPIANQILSKSQRIDAGPFSSLFSYRLSFPSEREEKNYNKNVDTQSNQKLSKNEDAIRGFISSRTDKFIY